MNATVSTAVEMQCADGLTPPDGTSIEHWVAMTLARIPHLRAGEIAVRLVGADEGRELNQRYRGRDVPTNVLAFPAESLPGLPPEALEQLGDLVICMPVLQAEAAAQGKTTLAHFAHLVVHGTLHLAGLHHDNEPEATQMEALEREIMGDLGFADPYLAEQG